MKPYYLLFLLALLPACAKYSHSVEFTHTGCATQTKAWWDGGSSSELILEYTPDGLAVTRTNAQMNCSIKNGGISCDVSVSGDGILYRVYETDGPTANCFCLVELMTSTVTGLQEDREYVLYYACGYGGGFFVPINFRYHKGLRMVLDAAQYRDDTTIINQE